MTVVGVQKWTLQMWDFPSFQKEASRVLYYLSLNFSLGLYKKFRSKIKLVGRRTRYCSQPHNFHGTLKDSLHHTFDIHVKPHFSKSTRVLLKRKRESHCRLNRTKSVFNETFDDTWITGRQVIKHFGRFDDVSKSGTRVERIERIWMRRRKRKRRRRNIALESAQLAS